MADLAAGAWRCQEPNTIHNESREKRMSKKVIVDPITRIEGHLHIETDVDDNGTITGAYSSGTMFRGIEEILQGRDPRDAWAITQRICGVCTIVHAMASVRAVENAVGYNDGLSLIHI